MDIFEYMKRNPKSSTEPLASRMRPDTIDEIVGQKHILEKNSLLYRAVKADKLGSIILYGPPGTGKTSLAIVIANTTHADFKQINATIAGKKEMGDVVDEAKALLMEKGQKTILFIDEIHRFNKSQQDFLLSYVEKGIITLIGATTENPYFEVNKALLSRSRIFELKELEKADIKELIQRAIIDTEKGMGNYQAEIDDCALDFISEVTAGDARDALNAIELGIMTTDRSEDGKIHITLKVAQECIQKKAVRYDKNGDSHYDTISAFIKSMRGSDPDATIYYLAKMLHAGEDIKFIARRIMISAAEDVSLADPMALVVATNASLAVERIGMPEARIILAQAALYISTAPKSNSSITAIDAALDVVDSGKDFHVPNHLKDRHYPGAAELGRGDKYKYPHDYEHNYVIQQYLPDELQDAVFYKSTNNGHEKDISLYFEKKHH